MTPEREIIPQDIFENKSGREQIMAESEYTWIVEQVTFNEGAKMYLRGASFPIKGIPTPEAVFAINTIKRIVIESLRLSKNWRFLPSLALIAIHPSKNIIQPVLEAFNRISESIISPFVITENCMMKCSKALMRLLHNFFKNLGATDEISLKSAKILSHIVEYDSAYRIRLQDAISETSKDKLMNPRKEIPRIFGVVASREIQHAQMKGKIRLFQNVISLALLSPKLNKALKDAIKSSNIDNLNYDMGDYYWALQRTDYQCLGKTLEERHQILKDKGWNIPESFKIQKP